MNWRISTLCACLIALCNLSAPSSAAVATATKWREHSSKAFMLSQNHQYEQALNQYRLALDAAQVAQAEPSARIDLQLDIVQLLVMTKQVGQADRLLAEVRATVLSKYKGTLLEARYWRRVRDVAEARHDLRLALAAQQTVVHILGQYFALTSPACLDELHILQELACQSKSWSDLLPITSLYKQQLNRHPSKMAEEKYKNWLREACLNLFAAARDRSDKYTSDQCLELMSLIPQVCPEPHEKLAMLGHLSIIGEKREQIQALRYYIVAAKALPGQLTKSETERLLGAYMAIMFWHVAKPYSTWDQEAEDCAKSATDLLSRQRPINFFILTQAQTVYGLIVARRGDPQRGSDIIDALRVPSDTVRKTMELGPYSSARPQIAEEFAKRGDDAGVRHQFDQLDAVVKSQTQLKADPALLATWHNLREFYLQQCKAYNSKK